MILCENMADSLSMNIPCCKEMSLKILGDVALEPV